MVQRQISSLGCEIPDCPGAPNCHNRGYCNSSVSPPVCQNCTAGWMGPACNDPCVQGVQQPMDSGNCVCEPGWAGLGCDSECSGHGRVTQGSCECDIGWRGTLCDNPGCPGIDEDCSGRGECNSALHECTCDSGWTGDGCEVPDCPGKPDCLDRGRLILVFTISK